MSYPKNWKVLIISEIGEVIGGGTPSTKNDAYYNGKISWITPKDLSNHKEVYISKGSRSISEEGLKNSSAKLMPKGTVLFTSRAPIGYVTIAKNEVCTNQGFKSIICNDGIDNKFIYYWLKQNKDLIESMASGSTFKEVSGGVLKSIKIVLPLLKEQKAISKILFDLDSKIETLQKQNKTLGKIGKILFKKDILELKEYNSSSLDQIADYLNGLALQKYPPKGKDDLYVIKIRELKQGITSITDIANSDLPSEYIIKDGDILFSWSGSLEVAIWCNGKGALNQHLFKVTSDKYPKWFYYYWTLHHLEQFKRIAADKATTMGHIKRRHLTDAKVKIPSSELMKKLDKQFSKIIEKQIIGMVEIRNLEKIRDLLLPKLMTGKIRVKVNE